MSPKAATKQNPMMERNTTLFPNRFYCAFMIFAVVVAIVNSYSIYLSWHMSCIGRIFLIKLLPFYDWTPLKFEQCCIDNWGQKQQTEIKESVNCATCENIHSIDVYENLDMDTLEEKYINRDVPVIITSALGKWPLNSKFTEDLKRDKYFAYSQPCKLSTNLLKDVAVAGEILDKTQHFDHFFVTFQNCDLEAMRALRRHCYRPDNIPTSYSPTIYNWLVWNKNYNATHYKPVDLVENVGIFGQLFGSTHIRLIPRKKCEGVCPILEMELSGKEMVVFTGLWDLEYRTAENGENMAVIMEIRG